MPVAKHGKKKSEDWVFFDEEGTGFDPEKVA